MRKSKRGQARRRDSSSLHQRHTSKRDLSEDLHRYNTSIAEQPDLFSATANPAAGSSSRGEHHDDRQRLTRFQRKEIGIRRLGHFVQFLFLLVVLTALTLLLVHSVTLYF